VIVPDLPVDEAASWIAAARANDLAPCSSPRRRPPRDRVRAIVAEGSGFIYCVSLLGVTVSAFVVVGSARRVSSMRSRPRRTARPSSGSCVDPRAGGRACSSPTASSSGAL